mmetsp:Transcript_72813/g.144700  ORF Transcript_72813/g.144700 Transcript_72813/m.144700 type:complete len:221 (-) Transcript_72813:36-698(-)
MGRGSTVSGEAEGGSGSASVTRESSLIGRGVAFGLPVDCPRLDIQLSNVAWLVVAWIVEDNLPCVPLVRVVVRAPVVATPLVKTRVHAVAVVAASGDPPHVRSLAAGTRIGVSAEGLKEAVLVNATSAIPASALLRVGGPRMVAELDVEGDLDTLLSTPRYDFVQRAASSRRNSQERLTAAIGPRARTRVFLDQPRMRETSACLGCHTRDQAEHQNPLLD